MVTFSELRQALKGKTVYATVMATEDFEVKISQADAQALRDHASGDIAWFVTGNTVTIEANATSRYGQTGDLS